MLPLNRTQHIPVVAGLGGAASAVFARRRRAAACFGAALALASPAGRAMADPYNPGHLSPDQLARVSQACETIVRVPTGERHYYGCVESLSESVIGARRSGVTPNPKEAEFAHAAAISTRSYFYASSAEVDRRMELSCLRVGLDPTSEGFKGCVANLAGALANIDLPPVT